MNPTQSPTHPHAAGKAAPTDTPVHVGQISGRLQAVYGQLGEQVADCSGYLPHQESNANAAFIVRACNSHAALVEALKAIREEATAYPEGGEDCFKYSLSLIAEKARAAIARATGQGGGE